MPKTESGCLETWMSGWRVLLLPFVKRRSPTKLALAARQLSLPHQDPADRFLAATAQVLDLTLVTGDAALLGLGEIATLGNR